MKGLIVIVLAAAMAEVAHLGEPIEELDIRPAPREPGPGVYRAKKVRELDCGIFHIRRDQPTHPTSPYQRGGRGPRR